METVLYVNNTGNVVLVEVKNDALYYRDKYDKHYANNAKCGLPLIIRDSIVSGGLINSRTIQTKSPSDKKVISQ